MQNENVYLLTVEGKHSQTTVSGLVSWMGSRGAKVEMTPSRNGNFEIVKINGVTAARAFKTQAEMLAFMMERL